MSLFNKFGCVLLTLCLNAVPTAALAAKAYFQQSDRELLRFIAVSNPGESTPSLAFQALELGTKGWEWKSLFVKTPAQLHGLAEIRSVMRVGKDRLLVSDRGADPKMARISLLRTDGRLLDSKPIPASFDDRTSLPMSSNAPAIWKTKDGLIMAWALPESTRSPRYFEVKTIGDSVEVLEVFPKQTPVAVDIAKVPSPFSKTVQIPGGAGQSLQVTRWFDVSRPDIYEVLPQQPGQLDYASLSEWYADVINSSLLALSEPLGLLVYGVIERNGIPYVTNLKVGRIVNVQGRITAQVKTLAQYGKGAVGAMSVFGLPNGDIYVDSGIRNPHQPEIFTAQELAK